VALLIVYRAGGDAFYSDVAERLYSGTRDVVKDVRLVTTDALPRVPADILRGTTVALVNPRACAGSPGVLAATGASMRKIAVLAEPAESEGYGAALALPLTFDALIDLGFVPQAAGHSRSDVPYHFVFNGATARETIALAEQSVEPRRIPWAVIGDYTLDEAVLTSELIRTVDPGGLVLLPPTRTGREDGGLVRVGVLRELLSSARYYVWCSRGPRRYYEHMRFVGALTAGAVPCRVELTARGEGVDVPWAFPSVDALCASLVEAERASMYRAARDYFLSKSSLARNLRTAYESIAPELV